MSHRSARLSRLPRAILTLTFLILTLAYASPSRAAAPPRQSEPEWLVMLYFDADDQTLEESILGDLNEAESIGSSDEVQIVAQIDRFSGGYDGMGDWTTAKRFYLTA